ncbi:MAG: hypothetical protein NTV49_06075 [Kiritimatiellaeota bacterium]|nr:hypothetical protein [Kiritimatiellota bacterium]
MRGLLILLGGMLALAAGSLLTGCEVGSADEVIAGAGGNFSGLYLNPDGGHLVSHNSGSPVDALNLQQDGNQLQAVDNNNLVFSGTLGDVSTQAVASFNLTGQTTAGAAVTVSGTLQKNGTTATMTGLWAEPSLYGSVYGRATVSASPTNQPPTTNTNTTIGARLQWGRTTPPRLWFERDPRPAGQELAQALSPGSRRRSKA